MNYDQVEEKFIAFVAFVIKFLNLVRKSVWNGDISNLK
jgi:hypothetical protein